MTPPLLAAYRIAADLASPLAKPILRRRARQGKEDPDRLHERLGRSRTARPDGPLIWLHGASVGESLSVTPLIEALRRRRPDLGVLVTAGTVAAAEILAQRLPDGVVHQYAPIDAPAAARRFLRHWRPAVAVFIESDLWPNLLGLAHQDGVRLALLSARLSDASLAGWARARRSAKALLSKFDLVMAQTPALAAALSELGARDDGLLNLKRLTPRPPVDAAELDKLRQAVAGRGVFLAASTHAGEEALVMDALGALNESQIAIIVPRHPSRADAIEEEARRRGLVLARRSRDEPIAGPLYLADTLGELGLFYALADLALIGGSLRPGPGGHNPIEPARLGCPIVSGPHVDNWRDIYDEFRLANAVQFVEGPAELEAAMRSAVPGDPILDRRAKAALDLTGSMTASLEAAADKLLALTP